MKITVVAPFEIPGSDSSGCLDVPEGSRVRNIPLGTGWIAGKILPVFVNGKQVKRSHVLHAGDSVIFIYPLRGG